MEATATVIDSTTKFRGVVTPHNPRTDEISAIVVMERILGKSITEIKLWGHPECSWDKIDEFTAQGLVPIEIGETGYQTLGLGSATEAVAVMLGREKDQLTPGEIKLVEMLARRNRNGYMNQFPMSLPRILKDLYDLPRYEELDLISRFKDVIHAFLEDEDREDSFEPDKAGHEITRFQDLVVATVHCQFAPLTPGRYLRDLWRRGESADQIREKVSFWINAWNCWQEAFRNAQHEWPRSDKLRFTFNGLDAAAIRTSNRFFSKICFNKEQPGKVDLLIIQGPSGHTAIMARKRNISVLNRELNQLEPGRWHYHQSAGSLINGGPMFPEVTPTSQTISQLAGLVSKFPPR